MKTKNLHCLLLAGLLAFAGFTAVVVADAQTVVPSLTTSVPQALAPANVTATANVTAAAPADTTQDAADVVNGILPEIKAVAATNTKLATIVAKVFGWLAAISGCCALTIKPVWDRWFFPALQAAATTATAGGWVASLLGNKIFKVAMWALTLLTHIKVPILDADGAAVSPSSAGTTLK